MKAICNEVLRFLGLQGASRKVTFCKILNWITSAGLLLSFLAWDFMVAGSMEKRNWIILTDIFLSVFNLISWWGFCQEEFHEKERRKGRIIEIVLFYGMLVVLFGLRICFVDVEKAEIWKWSFGIMAIVTGIISWNHHGKIGDGSW